jgi:hypothetical protein
MSGRNASTDAKPCVVIGVIMRSFMIVSSPAHRRRPPNHGMGFVLPMFTPDSTFRQQVRLEQAFPGECISALKVRDNDERSIEIERAIPGKNL